MRKAVTVLALGLFCAQTAFAETPATVRTEKREGVRGKRLWAGIALIVAGAGATTAGAVKWDDKESGGVSGGFAGTPPQPGNFTAPSGGSAGSGLPPSPPDALPSFRSKDRTGAAVAVGTGIAAVATGLVLVLTSHRRETTQRSLRVEPGLAQLRVVWSF